MATIMLEYTPPTIVLAGQSEVFVTHVVDPSHFHCQLMESASKLKALMDELHVHCTNCDPAEEALNGYDLGTPCLSQYSGDKEWYRVIITGMLANGLVEVSFVDFGNNEIADSSRLKKMKPEFMELPIQAIQCGLASIESPQGFWSPEHIAQFEDLILEKTFIARFISLLEGDSVCCVELLNKVGTSINKVYGTTTGTYKTERTNKFSGADDIVVSVNNREEGYKREAFRDSGGRKGFSAEKGYPERKLSSGSESSGSGRRPFGGGERSSARFSTGDGDKEYTPKTRDDSRAFYNDRRLAEEKEGRLKKAFMGDCGCERQRGNYNGHDDRCSTDYETQEQAMPRGSGNTWASGFRKSNDRAPARGTDMDNTFKSMTIALGEICEVYVSFVNTPEEFWIQFSKNTAEIDGLMEKIEAVYSALSPNENNLLSASVGTVCMARYAEDQRWYRAVVRQTKPDNSEVQFVDYGNSDFVPTNELKSVVPDFFSLPVQAVKCSLDSVEKLGSEWSDDAISKFEELTLDKPLSCKMIGCGKGDATSVQLTDPANGTSVSSALNQAGLVRQTQAPGQQSGQRSPPKKSSTAPPASGNFTEQQISQDQKANVVVSWMTNPEDFWCQLVSQQQQIVELNKTLQLLYEKSSSSSIPPSAIRKHMSVVAKFSADGCWYRGRVVDVSTSKAQVLFVDYGNTEVVGSSSLQYPQESTLKTPMLAVKCRLKDVKPAGNSWNANAVSLLETVVGDEASAVFYEKHGDAYIVDLLSGGKSACKELVKAGLAKSTGSAAAPGSFLENNLIQVSSEISVYITSIDGVESFWCQPSFAETVDLESAYASPVDTISNPAVGTPCVTQFSEDGLWYRAVVIQDLGNDCIVRFVDYGNAENVKKSSLKCVKPEFFNKPVQSFHCILNGIKDNGSTELKHKFNELTHDKELKAKITQKEGSRFHLDLYDSGSPLVQQLAPLCSQQTEADMSELLPVPNMTGQSFKAYVSATASLDEFYIQPADSQVDLDNMSELMKRYTSGEGNPLSSAARVGQVCAVKYSEDQAWYRGKITAVKGDTVHVLFVDYGNSEDISLKDTRKLLPSVLDSPPLAYPCNLANVKPPAGGWSSQAVAKFEEMVIDKELTCKFVAKSCVQITAPSGDVGQTLVTDGLAVSEDSGTRGSVSTPPTAPAPVTPAAAAPVRNFPTPTLASDTICGYVSHVDESGFYVQPTANTEQLESMTEELQKCAGALDGEPGLPHVEINQGCCAKYSEDNHWYRGTVVKIQGPEVTVRFVDYGNSETFNIAVVKNIPEALCRQAPMALHCHLNGKTSMAQADVDKLLAETQDVEITVKLLTRTAPYNVKLVNGNEPNVAAEISQPLQETVEESHKSVSLPEPELSPGIVKGYITEVDSSGLLFVQKDGDEDKIGELSEKLQAHDADFVAGKFLLTDVKVGNKCCARFSEDAAWYRAEVLNIGSETTVRFIDFGNCDKVKSVKELRAIPPDLTSTPPFCLVFKVDAPLSQEQASEAMQFVDGKCFEFEITNTTEPLKLKLKCSDGQQLLKLLNVSEQVPESDPKTEMVLAPKEITLRSFPSTVIPTGRAEGYVTAVEPSGEVFVQLVRDEEMLMALADRLQELAEGAQVLKSVVPGSACCAKFSEDEMWYRAVILACNTPMVKVRFIDYGNLDDVDANTLKTVPEDMLKEPYYCLTCRLVGCSQLSAEDVTKLVEETADKITNIEFAGKTEPYDINLFSTEGEDLVTKLGLSSRQSVPAEEEVRPPKSVSPSFESKDSAKYRKQVVPKGEKSAFVTHVQESGVFCIQLEDDTTKIESLSEKLTELAEEFDKGNQPLAKVEKDSICCCKYSEDGLWYRASVIDRDPPKVHVRFVDYGNEDTVLEKEICPVPPSLQSQTPYGFACRLQGVPLTSHQLEKFREITENDAVNVIFLTSTEPYEVTMSNSEGKLIQTLLGPSVDHVAAIVDKLLADSLAESATKDKSNASVPEGFKPLPLSAGSREEMYVSHVESPDLFWCHPAASEDQLAELMDVIADHCGQLTEDERGTTCAPDLPCLAKFTQDEGWYRAKVLSLKESGVEVFFVDYGNTDVVPEADVVSVKPEHLVLPAQAVQCRLFSEKPLSWKKDATDQFISLTADKKLLAEVKTCTQSDSVMAYSIQLLDMGVDISLQLFPLAAGAQCASKTEPETLKVPGTDTDVSQLTDSLKVQVSGSVTSLSETVDISEPPSSGDQQTPCDSFTNIILTEGSRVEVTVSHALSPTSFWVNLKANASQLRSMMDLLGEAMASVSSDGPCPDVNQPCAAQSAEDNVWYRGQVVEIDSALDLIDIFFVDFGITESVEKNNVRPIPPEFMALPVQAIQCSLSEIRFQGTMWTPEAKNRFNNLVLEKSLMANILQVGEDDDCIVQLLDMGICVAQKMITEGLGVSTDTPIPTPPHLKKVFTDSPFSSQPIKEETSGVNGNKETNHGDLPKITLTVGEERRVSVSHADSPGNFWCQLVSPVPQLDELTRTLQQSYHHTSTPVVPPPLWKLGQLCVSQSQEQYYRARIVSLTEDTAEVFYLDYGNTENVPVTVLRPISRNLLDFPAQAVRCSLAQVKPDSSVWEEISCNRFEEMTYSKELTANVLGFQNDAVFVDLRDDTVSINDSLVDGGYAAPASSEDPNVAILGSVSQALSSLEDSSATDRVTRTKKRPSQLPSPIAGSENGDSCEPDLNDVTSDIIQVNVVDYLHLELEEASEVPVYVCNISDPGSFGLQPAESSTELEGLMADIAEYVLTVDTPIDSDDLKIGLLCLAQFSDDDAWYRARITDIEDDQYQVLYVDYGNSELIPESRIRAIPDTMLTLPVQYVPCCLADIWADRDTWQADTTSFFKDLCEDKLLTARVGRRENGLYHVYLVDPEDQLGWSLNRYLLTKGVQLIPGSEMDIELEMEDSMQPDVEESFHDVSLCMESSFHNDENESDTESEITLPIAEKTEDDTSTIEEKADDLAAEAISTEEKKDTGDEEQPIKTETVEEELSGLAEEDYAEADQNHETSEISATEAEQPDKIHVQEKENIAGQESVISG